MEQYVFSYFETFKPLYIDVIFVSEVKDRTVHIMLQVDDLTSTKNVLNSFKISISQKYSDIVDNVKITIFKTDLSYKPSNFRREITMDEFDKPTSLELQLKGKISEDQFNRMFANKTKSVKVDEHFNIKRNTKNNQIELSWSPVFSCDTNLSEGILNIVYTRWYTNKSYCMEASASCRRFPLDQISKIIVNVKYYPKPDDYTSETL